jgi:hypothetical protein
MEKSWLHHLRAPYKALLVDYTSERLQAISGMKAQTWKREKQTPSNGIESNLPCNNTIYW